MIENEARAPRLRTAWALTDGKAGDEMQCVGVIERMGLVAERRRVDPRRPWSWLAPRGPIDPREAHDRPGSPIAPPFPDLIVASGRRAAPYLRRARTLSGGHTFTVFLKDARMGTHAADLIWVPAHDRLRGDNVLVTVTSPHLVSPDRLAQARAMPPQVLSALRSPRVAVLVGGDSAHHRFTPHDQARFLAHLERVAETGAALMGSASRRTPPGLAVAVRRLLERTGGSFWDGTGDNPYVALLALADFVVVTADSVNMVSEAAATGAPVLVFEPSGGHRKIGVFLDGLMDAGIVHRFEGVLEGVRYPPLDSTQDIAQAILRRLEARSETG